MANPGKSVTPDIVFHRYEDGVKNMLRILDARAEAIKLGGGREAIEKHHKRGKLTARERIQKLIDPGSDFLEIGFFAAYGMYEEYGGAPSSGTILRTGRILCRCIAVRSCAGV